ncbi:MAG TPA: glycosyltransferase family 4 protein [Nitrospiraceae bacterium]|jgi:glycosyltransferase involved in cell wall biosynthesis
MKIAQVSPLWESVPPKLYGGTERIVSYITEELVRQGHEVTLFASGDSVTDAKLESPCHQALRLNTGIFNREAPLISMMEQVFSSADQFDVIHSHLDFLAFSLSRRCQVPVVTTLHGRLDLPELVPVFRDFSELPLISISDSQRRPLPWGNWLGTVYHGLPANLYSAHTEPGKYLAFLGRISPEKCPDQAIELAKRVGMPLRIAAKVDPVDRAYFERVVEPLLDHPLVEFVGEVTDAQKNDFIGNAHALVCPYDWPEPFGLVLIEAMACGTPVLAYRRGSIPEVIDHGITGLISDNLAEMTKQVEGIPLVDRRGCRQMFEKRFTSERMVQNYMQIYHQMLNEPSVFHGQKHRQFTLGKAS